MAKKNEASVDEIMAYESGEMNSDQVIDFFGKLIKSGLCWALQGCYGRAAASMIEHGYISKSGEVLKYAEE